jgi:predicted AAA+ superfamily ATPase
LAVARVKEKRVVIFHGARGAGKSWLLHEIEYQLKKRLANIPTIYLDLLDYFNPSPEDAVRAIIGQVRSWFESAWP